MTCATVSRRTTLQAGLSLASVPLLTAPAAGAAPTNRGQANLALTTRWDKTFPQSGRVAHRKVTFDNRFGITIDDSLLPRLTDLSSVHAVVTEIMASR